MSASIGFHHPDRLTATYHDYDGHAWVTIADGDDAVHIHGDHQRIAALLMEIAGQVPNPYPVEGPYCLTRMGEGSYCALDGGHDGACQRVRTMGVGA